MLFTDRFFFPNKARNRSERCCHAQHIEEEEEEEEKKIQRCSKVRRDPTGSSDFSATDKRILSFSLSSREIGERSTSFCRGTRSSTKAFGLRYASFERVPSFIDDVNRVANLLPRTTKAVYLAVRFEFDYRPFSAFTLREYLPLPEYRYKTARAIAVYHCRLRRNLRSVNSLRKNVHSSIKTRSNEKRSIPSLVNPFLRDGPSSSSFTSDVFLSHSVYRSFRSTFTRRNVILGPRKVFEPIENYSRAP